MINSSKVKNGMDLLSSLFSKFYMGINISELKSID